MVQHHDPRSRIEMNRRNIQAHIPSLETRPTSSHGIHSSSNTNKKFMKMAMVLVGHYIDLPLMFIIITVSRKRTGERTYRGTRRPPTTRPPHRYIIYRSPTNHRAPTNLKSVSIIVPVSFRPFVRYFEFLCIPLRSAAVG
ncbi:hypothetical protein BD410DRAFT_470150 [Rickenella mellea]|uniref:Uncharacterized protein n=1 Tax=Rickenella mellea TaxID=50990 RepID=A0A4Y7QIZ4_9AGAM|nr:hypothetical protein BD410DRAFT_470150 [Rickenella mellea]